VKGRKWDRYDGLFVFFEKAFWNYLWKQTDRDINMLKSAVLEPDSFKIQCAV
jgi:hypothetical protein